MNEKINLLEILPKSRLQTFQNAFSKSHHVATIMMDIEGKLLTEPSGFCQLCHLIRGTVQGELDCQDNYKRVGEQASRTGEYAIQTCVRTGFADACAPLTIRGEQIASWGIGQANIQGGATEYEIRQYAKKIGIDPDEAAAAFQEKQHNTMPMQQFQDIIEELLRYSQQIITSTETSYIAQRFDRNRRSR